MWISQTKWELFSQIKYYSAKYYSAKYYSAKWDIIQPNVSKATFGWIIFSAKCPLRRSSGGLQHDDGHKYDAYLSPPCLFYRRVGCDDSLVCYNSSHPTRLSKDLNSEPTKNQPTTVGGRIYGGIFFISQIFIIQPNIYYSAKWELFSQILFSQILFSQMKYYSAKWNIIQPSGNIIQPNCGVAGVRSPMRVGEIIT